MIDISSWSFNVDNVNHWAYWEKSFSDEECDEIIRECKKLKLSEGLIRNEINNEIKSEYRNSKIVFVGSKDLEWAYRKLTDICVNLNERFFDFDLWGFSEGLQFTEYKAPSGKYDSHIDKILNGPIRKLSVVVQLTDPKKYKGCDLELLTSDNPISISRERGYLVLFPSYTLHRVTPIEKGTRHSLVGWITGKPFK